MEKFEAQNLLVLKEKVKINFDSVINRCFKDIQNTLELGNRLTKLDISNQLKLMLNYEITRYLNYELSED